MNRRNIFAAVLALVFSSGPVVCADGLSGLSATNSTASNAVAAGEMPLTNKAVQVISRLRGVEPSKVKLRPGRRAAGPFEIDIDGVPDGKHEALELSKELGPAATVIFEHVSADGLTRTNWSFRGGAGRQVTAPAGPARLGPNGKKLYVWPQSSVRPSAPTGMRVRTSENE